MTGQKENDSLENDSILQQNLVSLNATSSEPINLNERKSKKNTPERK